MKLLNSREDSESDHGSVVKREKREASRMRECKEYILCLDIRIQSLISQTTKAPTFWADPSLHWIFKVWFESLEGFDTLISLFVPRWNSFLKILIFFFHVIYKKSMDGEERFGRANNGHQLNMEREGGGEREGHMEAGWKESIQHQHQEHRHRPHHSCLETLDTKGDLPTPHLQSNIK